MSILNLILSSKLSKPILCILLAAAIFFAGRMSVKQSESIKEKSTEVVSNIDLTEKRGFEILLPEGTLLPNGIKLSAPALFKGSEELHLLDKSVARSHEKEIVAAARPFLYVGINYSKYLSENDRQEDSFGASIAVRLDENIITLGYIPKEQKAEASILMPLPVKWPFSF